MPEGTEAQFTLSESLKYLPHYEMRSDLLVDNLTWLKRKVWVGDYKNTENEYVSRQHRVDDTEIKAGQAFMVRVTADVTLDFKW